MQLGAERLHGATTANAFKLRPYSPFVKISHCIFSCPRGGKNWRPRSSSRYPAVDMAAMSEAKTEATYTA